MRTSAAGAARGAGTSPPVRVPRGTGRTSEGPQWCQITVVPTWQQGRRRHVVTTAVIACLRVAVPPAGTSVVPWGCRAPGGHRAAGGLQGTWGAQGQPQAEAAWCSWCSPIPRCQGAPAAVVLVPVPLSRLLSPAPANPGPCLAGRDENKLQ